MITSFTELKSNGYCIEVVVDGFIVLECGKLTRGDYRIPKQGGLSIIEQ